MLKKFYSFILALVLVMNHMHIAFALDLSSVQLLSNDTNEVLSNAKVTVFDVETSNSYYLTTNSNGYIVDEEHIIDILNNKLLVITATYDNYVYNICVDSLNNQIHLAKDYQVEYNSNSRYVSGDWVTNKSSYEDTIWVALDKAPGYGGLSMKTEYNSDVGYTISGGLFLTCSFTSLSGTSFEPDYTDIPASNGSKNYVLYGEVNRYKLEQSQVGTGATRIRYIITGSVINIEPVLESGTFSTTTSSTDSKLLKNSTTTVKKYISSTYTFTSVTEYNYGLTFSIAATGSKQNIRYYKQYSNQYYYRIGLNALDRKTTEF